MKLVLIAVLAIIIAGHFLPLEVKSTNYSCAVGNKTYRLISGELAKFRQDSQKNNIQDTICGDPNSSPNKTADFKLYLW